jgi:hypothetical protein
MANATNLSVLELLGMANEAYPDGFLACYFDKSTGQRKEGSGDSLAQFIVSELTETFDPQASSVEQREKAQHVLENAIGALRAVVDRLEMSTANPIHLPLERLCDVQRLISEFGEWGEHPKVPRSDWQYEVGNGDSQRGYWDFVAAKLE